MAKKYLLYIHHPNFATEQDKSKLVNQLLADYYDGPLAKIVQKYETIAEGKPDIPIVPTVNSAFTPKPPDPNTGYPCCLNKSPCKHWSWNGDTLVWVNSITGNTREAE